MPRRPAPPPIPPVLTIEQLHAELTRILERLQELSSDHTLTNGQFRYRLKRLERRLADLLGHLHTLQP